MGEVSGGGGLSESEVLGLVKKITPTPESIAAALLGNSMPKAEGTSPTSGQATVAARDDHRHERLTSVTVGTIAAGNTVAILFTRAFTYEPGIVYQELPASENTTAAPAADTAAGAQPTESKVVAWTMGPTSRLPEAPAGAYTGCTVRVWKSQTIPQNVVSLLTTAVFNIFAASVVGVRFSITAIARSDVAST